MKGNSIVRFAGRALGMASVLVLSAATTHADPPISVPTKIFIVNRIDSTVSLVDLTTKKELRTLHVGPLPYYAQLSKDEKTLIVSVEGDEAVKFYDVATFAKKGEVHIGKMYAEHMALTPDGNHVVIANRYGDAVVGINISTMKEEFRVPVSSPHNIRLGASGKYLYVTSKINPGFNVIDLQTHTLKHFFPVKFVPRGLAVSDDEKVIYAGANWVNGMFEIDANTGNLIRYDPLPLPTGKTKVEENTYHGFEVVNDDIVLGTNEGLSALDVINSKTGALANRTTAVANPGAILMVPGMKNRFVVTNRGDNTIEVMEVQNNHDLKVISTMKVGRGVGDLPKRFVFYYQ